MRWPRARLPFRGESIGSDLGSDPEPHAGCAVRLNPDCPPELERVISQGSGKRSDLRYQHAADLRSDLRRLTRDSAEPLGCIVFAQDGSRNLQPSGRFDAEIKGVAKSYYFLAAAALVVARIAGAFFFHSALALHTCPPAKIGSS